MKKRIISAIIMAIIFIPILIIGNTPFYILFSLLGCMALYELIKLREINDYKLPFLVKILSFLIMFYIVNSGNNIGILYGQFDYKLIIYLLFIFLFPTILIGNNDKYSYIDGFYLLASTIFIGFSFSMIVLVRNYSLSTLIYLLSICIFTDTFGLVIGKLLGKHKLVPKISPKKTVEGLIGGTLFGTVFSVIIYLIFVSSKINLFNLITLTICLSLTASIGDLIFSFIKRNHKIKDFSNIIPGHGGILDRLDSLIFVVLMYILFIGII